MKIPIPRKSAAQREEELLRKALAFLNEDAMVPGRIIYLNLGLTERECKTFGIDPKEFFVDN